jgi:hypothetical protein
MLTPIPKCYNGSISGTGTFELDGNIIGAIVMSANGTNSGTVLLREKTSAGKVLFHCNNLYTLQFNIHVTSTTRRIYYSISGTGCSAMIYEYIP